MHARLRRLSFAMAFTVCAVGSVAAQPARSTCVSCHTSSPAAAPSPAHLAEWRGSAHATRGIGCEQCHGGDSRAEVAGDAHRGVLHAAHFQSPVHPKNLARTCARCHLDNARAFQGSMHFTLAWADDRRAPTCVTCHGVMSARVPSPDELEARCAACHRPGSFREAYPGRMRGAVETLNGLRARATRLWDAVDGLTDDKLRVELLTALAEARSSITDAVARVHAFDFSGVAGWIVLAGRQLDAVDTAVYGLP